MSRSSGRPSRSGGTRCPAPDRTPEIWVTAVILLVVASSLGLLAALAPAAGGASAPATARSSSGLEPAQVPPTHGDLVVAPGETYVIQPTTSSATYYQGGNITVEAGGTLDVKNITLSFAEYVSNSGTAEQRLSHIYHFVDDGTVNFYRSNLTTDVAIINAYAKLNFTVTGVLNVMDSTFAFPGWLYINGSGADVTLNASAITRNAAILPLFDLEPSAIWGDTVWAPTVSVLGGAKLNLFASTVNDTYKNDLNASGYARPTPLVGAGILGSGGLVAQLNTSSTPESLALDWSYPTAGVVSGFLEVNYVDSNLVNTFANLAVSYGGTDYPIGTVTFKNLSTSSVTDSVPRTLTSAISAQGLLQFLNYTGAFDTTGQIFAEFTSVTGPSVNLTGIDLQVNTTGPEFNLTVAGSGSELTAVDSSLDINWQTVGGGLYSTVPPLAWNSNKLAFNDGAVGYLANITTLSNGLVGVFSTSAILPDSTSQVYLYRWAQVNITSTPGRALEGAQVSVYYAYSSSQANNATATAVNNIATADPAMWAYLQYWDQIHGASGWGISNARGLAALLVASNELTYPTLPDGNFLGGYHVEVSVPGRSVPSHWFNWSVTPYPQGVAFGTAGYGLPDSTPAQAFPNYVFEIRVTSATPPSSTTLSLSAQYYTTGTVAYNTTATAVVDVYATPTSGGAAILVGQGSATANTQFTVTWFSLSGVLSAGTSYTLSVTATADGVTSAPYQIPGTFTVASPSTNFFTQTFLGLPVWLWIAIAAAAVVAIVLFLVFARRQAAGKLVECGECGNLIPEDATVCPKCGAEFETDLLRCSRCASTIPADSKFCPECAAPLLGALGEAKADPEKQAYADFTEKYRAEAKRELGDNYSEGAFWDWWKRQPTYTPFSQWSLQQGQGTARAGMTAPPTGTETAPPETAPPAKPPKGGGPGTPGWSEAAAAAAAPAPTAEAPPTTTPTAAPPPPGAAGLKPCPSCGKEIPAEYLVCPFCNAVTQ